MIDIVLEIIRAAIVCIIFVYLFSVGIKKNIYQQKGWNYIIGGFACILFGMLIDITDNFSSLNKYLIIGDTEYQAFLEKVVGYLFGFLLLAVGFWRWIPSVIFLQETRSKLQAEIMVRKQTQLQLFQSAKLASIGELASGVAHELNQPLMVIRGNAQLIQRNLKKNNSGGDALADQFEPIVKNTKRMMNIINHLRTFSRQSQKEFKSMDVNLIVKELFLMVGEQLRLRNIEVKKELMHGLPIVQGDANQLEQVILNLIANARDAVEMRDDGRGTRDERGGTKEDSIQDQNQFNGRIEIITRRGELPNQPFDSDHGRESVERQSTINNPWPRPGRNKSGDRKMEMEEQYKQDNIQIPSRQGGQQSKSFIEILIKDNGGGIPAESIDKIFDPFFTTKKVGKGTGLGLSISYGIIQNHKGEIEVAETGPEGTTCRVRLPIVDG